MFAVFGNPIAHSKSPEIYSLFANEIGIPDKYDLKLASQENFDDILLSFFDGGGLGANITVPFKERAYLLCDQLTDRAMIANSVNTIKKQSDNTLLGDNTDGIGFINDLKRLNWFDKNQNIADFYIDIINNKPITSNVLIIGSGGAAKGIIAVLSEIKECYINVVNRTLLHAQKLVYYYHKIGRQNISYVDIHQLSSYEFYGKYNFIINASSSSMYGDIPKIPSGLIKPVTKCYDLFYQKEDTVFIKWCKKHGSVLCADGLGMLIEQAACSFYLWHNQFPSVDPVLNHFRSMI